MTSCHSDCAKDSCHSVCAQAMSSLLKRKRLSPSYWIVCRPGMIPVVNRAGHSLFFFQVCSPLIFYPWIAIAHFADFQARSSLNRSLKDQWFALEKER